MLEPTHQPRGEITTFDYSFEVEVRDLTPKSDVKGGATEAKENEKHASHRTGEIDFMMGVN